MPQIIRLRQSITEVDINFIYLYMHKNHIEGLSSMSNEERLEHFIQTVVDLEEVWGVGLNNENWITQIVESEEIFYVWQYKEFAESCNFLKDNSSGERILQITLDSFINNCLPDLINKNIKIAVSINLDRDGLIIDPQYLLNELNDELDYVES